MLHLFQKSKPTPEDPARFLREHAGDICGSLCAFGDWFGRPMDNLHKLVSFEAKEDYLRLSFNEGETLEVWSPQGLKIEGKRFLIQHAKRVRWEWFYYGRPKLPENRYFVEHVTDGEAITASSNVDWAPHNFKPSRAEPAVSIQ